ncbi:uncharacterized protein LOC113057827 [Carassius auratus]|uniref:Uncharacterized protein LOC113057827 n=1 Tax=Carassius auratus TaxID=7957 RepID=A0A6P6L9C0_CARAU|nr:uncharacterized protein LOC113057827 [Carassius auratus]
MADNYQDGFENQDFDEGLDQILEELFDENVLFACDEPGAVNNDEQDVGSNQELITPPENVAQEVEISTESQHALGHVTKPASADAPDPEGDSHNLPDVSNVRTEASVTCRVRHSEGQGVKRLRLPEWGTDDVPSTSRLRTSENNEQRYDEGGVTAWSDSMVSAWDRASFSDSASEEETEELPNEDPQELFRERDLNRRLDYDMLRRVNRRFGTLFDLSGQALSYRGAEEIVGNAQSDVVAILRNIIECQQQLNESLRHAAEFWRSCHDQLYGEFRQFQQRMNGVPGEIHQVQVEQNLIVNALTLISERLNLMQRMLSDLYRRDHP